MIDVRDLARGAWAVIDLDDGTVHSTNVVLVARQRVMPTEPAAVWAYGRDHGTPLCAFHDEQEEARERERQAHDAARRAADSGG